MALTSHDFTAHIVKYIPQFKIAFKDKSNFMKLLSKLLFFLPTFMSGFITTIGYTVYIPSQQDYENSPDKYLGILAHEFVHMMDYKKYGILFKLSYLLPQLLAVISLSSILAIWFSHLWLLSLFALIFIAPIPAYFRTSWELRGYAMSMAYTYWSSNKTQKVKPQIYLDMFTSSYYYWMWPFSVNMLKKLQISFDKIYNNSILSDEPYKIVHDWINEQEKN